MLGEFEQLVLLAVMHAGDDAYGVTIHAELTRRTGRQVAVASVYKTLERLREKGLLASRLGESTPERGGRRKQYYSVTAVGRREVKAAIRALTSMARGLDVGIEPA